MPIWLIVILSTLSSYWFGYFVFRGCGQAWKTTRYLDTFEHQLIFWLITIVFEPWWFLKDRFWPGQVKDTDWPYPKPETLNLPYDPRPDWDM